MSDTLDNLAVFLMHRTADTDMSEKRRLSIFVLVGAYQEQIDPPTVEAALRNAAGAFADHPDYRAEWAVRDGEENITIERSWRPSTPRPSTPRPSTPRPSTPHISPDDQADRGHLRTRTSIPRKERSGCHRSSSWRRQMNCAGKPLAVLG